MAICVNRLFEPLPEQRQVRTEKEVWCMGVNSM